LGGAAGFAIDTNGNTVTWSGGAPVNMLGPIN